MPNQERPLKPIVESYVPPAGIRHAVTAGETWISLAKRIGIDPWDLIEFNFPGIRLVKQRDFQQATRQVNWYLAEYVGCRAMSPDRQNLRFHPVRPAGKVDGEGDSSICRQVRRLPHRLRPLHRLRPPQRLRPRRNVEEADPTSRAS